MSWRVEEDQMNLEVEVNEVWIARRHRGKGWAERLGQAVAMVLQEDEEALADALAHRLVDDDLMIVLTAEAVGDVYSLGGARFVQLCGNMIAFTIGINEHCLWDEEALRMEVDPRW